MAAVGQELGAVAGGGRVGMTERVAEQPEKLAAYESLLVESAFDGRHSGSAVKITR